MANILVAATPSPGHVNPMLSVARHLSSLGHSITFLSGRLFRDQAVALGFQFVPFSGVADFDYRRLPEEFPEVAAKVGHLETLSRDLLNAQLAPSFIFNHLDTMNGGPNFSSVTPPRKKGGL